MQQQGMRNYFLDMSCHATWNKKVTSGFAFKQSPHSIGLMWWMLSREVLRLRGTITRDKWGVMVDLFFYRDPEEAEKEEQLAKEQMVPKVEEAVAVPPVMPESWPVEGAGDAAAPVADPAVAYTAPTEDWSAEADNWAQETQDWGGSANWAQ